MSHPGVRISNFNRTLATQTVFAPKAEETAKAIPPTRNCGTTSSVTRTSESSQLNPDRCVTEYLTQLLRDQANLHVYRASHVVMYHVDRLLEEEIEKVRSKLLESISDATPPLQLPEQTGEIVTLIRKVFFPKQEFPDFNFTGRILGPRGATIKRLEKEIGSGCTLAIRGKGSDPKNEAIRPNKEEQHVLVTIKEHQNRAQLVLDYALKKIQPFLVPVDEEKDELKRSQMIELALLKGNYRDAAMTKQLSDQMQRMVMTSPMYNTMPANAAQNYYLLTPPPSPTAAAAPQIPINVTYGMYGLASGS